MSLTETVFSRNSFRLPPLFTPAPVVQFETCLAHRSASTPALRRSSRRDVYRATCRKCQLERQAKALKIRVHEWPLPRSTAQAQLAVFELAPPRPFSTWRDITYMVLRDIGLLSVPDPRDQPKVLLDAFSGLESWAPEHQQDYRVTVGSATKSFSDQTHYKMVGI